MTEDAGVRDLAMARIEALLFSAEEPIPARRLASLAGIPGSEIPRILQRLSDSYDRDGSAFHVAENAAGFHLATRAELGNWLGPWKHSQELQAPSGQALQTLAMIAYRQPITKADVEATGGVAAAELLKQLIEDGWIKVVGREESLGRPQLYGTTRKFLQEFGFRNLGEMPPLPGDKST